jgi:hypothetical protein
MKGTAKVKDSSRYVYKGKTLNILTASTHHQDPEMDDIYPVGSVTYKLCLKGTEWDNRTYTVIHDSELEDIQVEGSLEATIWYDRLSNGEQGKKALEEILNPCGDKTPDEIYEDFKNLRGY